MFLQGDSFKQERKCAYILLKGNRYCLDVKALQEIDVCFHLFTYVYIYFWDLIHLQKLTSSFIIAINKDCVRSCPYNTWSFKHIKCYILSEGKKYLCSNSHWHAYVLFLFFSVVWSLWRCFCYRNTEKFEQYVIPFQPAVHIPSFKDSSIIYSLLITVF